MQPTRTQDLEVSIIIPVYNEAHRLRETVLAVSEAADVAHEIVVVDDGSTDGCADFLQARPFDFKSAQFYRSSRRLGVAGARNFGFRQSRAPVVMFLDGHCQPSHGFLSHMLRALRRLGRGVVIPQVTAQDASLARGFGMTLAGPALVPVWLGQQFEEPYFVPIGCGCCQMCFRAWFEQIGYYDHMRTYGVEDLELSVRSWLLGGPIQVVPKAVVAHYFRSQTTCNVTWADVVYNSLRMAHLHFSGPRLGQIVAHWQSRPEYGEAEQWLRESEIPDRRAWLDKRRRHSADWFCDRFEILPLDAVNPAAGR